MFSFRLISFGSICLLRLLSRVTPVAAGDILAQSTYIMLQDYLLHTGPKCQKLYFYPKISKYIQSFNLNFRAKNAQSKTLKIWLKWSILDSCPSVYTCKEKVIYFLSHIFFYYVLPTSSKVKLSTYVHTWLMNVTKKLG